MMNKSSFSVLTVVAFALAVSWVVTQAPAQPKHQARQRARPQGRTAVVHLNPPGKDITFDLVTALTYQPDEIHIPRGDWQISKTIYLDAGHKRMRITGPRKGATLQWTGRKQGVMFHLQGANWIDFQDLTLHGGGKKQGTRLIVLRSQKGHATGNLIMTRCKLAHAAVGVMFGATPHETNCDNSRFYQVKVDHCGIGFWVRTEQAMNFTCEALWAYWTDTVWQLDRGGLLLVNGAQTGGIGTFLQVNNGAVNVGVAATLINVRNEARTNNYRLVKAMAKWNSVVNIIGYASTMTGNQLDKPLHDLLIGPGNHVNVIGSTFANPMRIAELRGTKQKPATLTMTGCMFFAPLDPDSFNLKGPNDEATVNFHRNGQTTYQHSILKGAGHQNGGGRQAHDDAPTQP